MRKIWSISLAFCMLFALTACKKESDKPETPATESASAIENTTNPPSVKDHITQDTVVVIPEKDSTITIPDVQIPGKVERGNQIGDYCPAAKQEITDGNGGTGMHIDPSATGRMTVIYFWGVWNDPAVQGLLALDRLAAELGEDVAIIAVHTPLSGEKLQELIGVEYPDSAVIFTQDSGMDTAGAYYTALGGTGNYPMTVVLNPKGQILEIIDTPIDYELLCKALGLTTE